jgi:cytochrome c oxidase subunit IV
MDIPVPPSIPHYITTLFMENTPHHVSSYSQLTRVLILLLALTFLTVAITSIHLGPLTVAVALIIASVKVFLVLIFFMHLKYESLFLKLMVSGVFLLFALVIITTFIDYLTR